MAEQRLQFIIDAEDRTREAFKNIEGNLKGMQGRLKDMQPAFKKMALAGSVAFGAITAAVGLSIQESIKFEAAQNRLSHILKTSRQATDEQIDSLFEQAKQLEKVGVITAEATMQAQAQLATFDLETESIKRLIPSILDYVVAEKGASAGTEDLKQLTNGLAQALQGNFGSLTRTGFVLDDATKELIKNGTEAERTAALVDVLNSTYKGFNEAARDTAEGSLIVMRNEFNNLRRAIGDAFIPVLAEVVGKLTPLIEKMAGWIQANPELTKRIIIAAGAITGLVAVVGTLGLLLPSIIAGFVIVLGPIGLVTAAIVALTAFGIIFAKNWNKIKDGFILAWEDIKTRVGEIVNWMMDKIQPLISAFERISGFVSGMRERVGGAISGIRETLSGSRQFGGDIPSTGAYLLHKGERVMPAGAGIGGITLNITGTFLSETVAEELGNVIIHKLKRVIKL